MKAFKIKKRSQRQPIFIIGEPLAFFKPNFPHRFFKSVHPPITKKPDFKYEVVVQTIVEQADSVAAVLPDSSDSGWTAVRDYIAGQEGLFQDPEVDS